MVINDISCAAINHAGFSPADLHMTLKGKRICLVSSGYAGSNPRLLKEADALVECGVDVHVLTLNISAQNAVQTRDTAVLENAKWAYTRITGLNNWHRYTKGVIKRICKFLFRVGIKVPVIVQTAFHPWTPRIGQELKKIQADLYIAHNLGALPAACLAARVNKAKVGFDAEDFHSGEYPAESEYSDDCEIVKWLEARYLPVCDYISAASPGISAAYVSTYGITPPAVILNVFPLSDSMPWLNNSPARQRMRAREISLYWFSQTIGEGRGLEQIITAVSCCKSRVRLVLQGGITDFYRNTLVALATGLGIGDRVQILPPILPGELVGQAAIFDFGVCSECSKYKVNQDILLSNKLFTYLLAGLPVLCSDTSAQKAFASEAGDAILLYSQSDTKALANTIDYFAQNPDAYEKLSEDAWNLGQKRYNWDLEKTKFYDLLTTCFIADQMN